MAYCWWGGAVAPAMFKMQRCNNCRMEFNRETGKPLTTTMWVYQIVILAIVLIIALGFSLAR